MSIQNQNQEEKFSLQNSPIQWEKLYDITNSHAKLSLRFFLLFPFIFLLPKKVDVENLKLKFNFEVIRIKGVF